MTTSPNVRILVLDAGPLLSLNPLRGMAERYVTVPQVIAELKDPRAREHLERLELSSGIKLEVLDPDAASLAKGMVLDIAYSMMFIILQLLLSPRRPETTVYSLSPT